MNFNRRDSLNFDDVLNNPQFVAFLRKWESNRRPNAVRELFSSNVHYFVHSFMFGFIKVLNNLFFSFLLN